MGRQDQNGCYGKYSHGQIQEFLFTVLILKRRSSVSEIYKKIVRGAGGYLEKDKPGNILISDKTAEILKLKQYCLTDEVIDKLERGKVPGNILSKLGSIKDERFRSPKDFRDALKSITDKERARQVWSSGHGFFS